MKRWAKIAGSVLVTGALGLAGTYLVRTSGLLSAKYNLKLAIGPVGSDGQKVLAAFVRDVSADHPMVRLLPIPTKSLTESGKALVEGRVDLAVVRSDDEAAAFGRTVFLLGRLGIGVLLPPDSPIENVSELAGKKLAVIDRNGSDPGLLKAFLDFYGLHAADLTEMPQAQFGPALRAKRAAAVIVFGPVGSGPIADAISSIRKSFKTAPKILDIPEADAIAARAPAYQSLEIKQGAFGGAPAQPGEDINTVAMSIRLVSLPSMPDRVAGEITRLLLTTKAKLITTVPAAAQMEAPETEVTSLFAVHPGSLSYLNGDQESLLDQTSNYYYFAGMVLALFAPLAGWFSSRQGKRQRSEARMKLFRAVEIAQLSKTASADELRAADQELLELTHWTYEKFADGEVERDQFQCIDRMITQVRRTLAARLAELSPVAERT